MIIEKQLNAVNLYEAEWLIFTFDLSCTKHDIFL